MRFRTILHISAINCLFLAVAFLVCAAYAALCGDGPALWRTFVACAGIVSALGGTTWALTRGEEEPTRKDGFAIVVLGWILITGLGTLPFLLTGAIPRFAPAFFESVSGFTTTGATVLTNLEALPKSVLFYRSLTQLMGGMGILVMVIAILPFIKGGAFSIFQAEVSGPSKDKIAPQVVSTAKIICLMFLGMWFVQLVLLMGHGLPFLDAFTLSTGSISTGGFSNRTASAGAYGSVFVETVVIIGMLLGGTNFALHYAFFRRNWAAHLRDEEFRVYAGVFLGITALIALNLWWTRALEAGPSVRHAAFQVASLLTSTGFMSTDFDQWPDFSRVLLVVVMFSGACAGSTTGAVKIVRLIIVVKSIYRELRRLLHPNGVYKVKLSGRVIDEPVVAGVAAFFAAYLITCAVAVVLVTPFSPDLTCAVTGVITAMGNMGPGLGKVGPAMDFSVIEPTGQMILSFCMLLGRLEIFSFFVLFAPDFWRK